MSPLDRFTGAGPLGRLRARRLAAATVADLLPPPPSAFGGFGARSHLVPPVRVHNPGFIHVGDDVTVLELSFLSVQPTRNGAAPRLEIGDGSFLSAMTTVACVGSVRIGRRVLSASRVFIGDASHAYTDPDLPVADQGMAGSRPVVIGDGCFIGIGAVILPGSVIGDGAVVGAGAVVSGEVPPRTVVVGNPARVVRRHDPELGWVEV